MLKNSRIAKIMFSNSTRVYPKNGTHVTRGTNTIA